MKEKEVETFFIHESNLQFYEGWYASNSTYLSYEEAYHNGMIEGWHYTVSTDDSSGRKIMNGKLS